MNVAVMRAHQPSSPLRLRKRPITSDELAPVGIPGGNVLLTLRRETKEFDRASIRPRCPGHR